MVKEVWAWKKKWYKAMADRDLPPAWVTIERIKAEQVIL